MTDYFWGISLNVSLNASFDYMYNWKGILLKVVNSMNAYIRLAL
jgi:hypothetical protein